MMSFSVLAGTFGEETHCEIFLSLETKGKVVVDFSKTSALNFLFPNIYGDNLLDISCNVF